MRTIKRCPHCGQIILDAESVEIVPAGTWDSRPNNGQRYSAYTTGLLYIVYPSHTRPVAVRVGYPRGLWANQRPWVRAERLTSEHLDRVPAEVRLTQAVPLAEMEPPPEFTAAEFQQAVLNVIQHVT